MPGVCYALLHLILNVELEVEQLDDEHSGDPLMESASVQLGLFGGLPVAASKPPSWMSCAATAGPVMNGASTSPDVTSAVAHAADSRLRTDMTLLSRWTGQQTKWPATVPAEIVETSRVESLVPGRVDT